MYGQQYGAAGSVPKPSAIFAQGKRRRMNLVAICVNIFMPWLMFCIIYWALSFSFHYQYPSAAWMIFALGLLGVIVAALVERFDIEPYSDFSSK